MCFFYIMYACKYISSLLSFTVLSGSSIHHPRNNVAAVTAGFDSCVNIRGRSSHRGCGNKFNFTPRGDPYIYCLYPEVEPYTCVRKNILAG